MLDLRPVPEDACDARFKFRTITGRCNNLHRPSLGAAMADYRRLLRPAYDDGTNSARLSGRSGRRLPSARLVSTTLHATTEAADPRHSHLLMQWGQFLDHDLSFTPETRPNISASYGRDLDGDCGFCLSQYRERKPHCIPIPIPDGDPHFQPGTCMKFVRSAPGMNRQGPREQMNLITAYIDASNVYGSDERTAFDLRTYKGGLLKTSSHGSLPFDPSVKDCKRAAVARGCSCFKAGDRRVNEQPGLMALHALWVAQHNRLARRLSALNADWDDERLYQEARRIVGAQHQHITYSEWLPKVLGPELVRRLEETPVDSSGLFDCDASILNEFATAAFRFGHTLVGNLLQRHGNATIRLDENFMDPSALSGPDALGLSISILRGLSGQSGQQYDKFISRSMRERLFIEKGARIGMDIMALNIQRGRDHGLRPYSDYRRYYGLSPGSTWEGLGQIVGRKAAEKYRQVYEDPGDIDLFSGMIAEPPLRGGLVGELCGRVLVDQFRRLKRCDRFFYETRDQVGSFTSAQLAYVRATSLADVICANSGGLTSAGDAFDSRHGAVECQRGPGLRAEELSAWSEARGPPPRPTEGRSEKTTTTTTAPPATQPPKPEMMPSSCGLNIDHSFIGFHRPVHIRSPNYPQAYPGSCQSTWKFSSSLDAVFVVKFMGFDLENGYDRLRLLGDDRIMADCSGQGCHESEDIRVEAGSLEIAFESDESVNHQGFFAVVDGFDDGRREYWLRQRECSSEAPWPGARAAVKINTMRLEDGCDFVRIFDGTSTSPQKMKVVCTCFGSCSGYVASAGDLTVTFESDGSNQSGGFSALVLVSTEGVGVEGVGGGGGACDSAGLAAVDGVPDRFTLCQAPGLPPKICHCWSRKSFDRRTGVCR